VACLLGSYCAGRVAEAWNGFTTAGLIVTRGAEWRWQTPTLAAGVYQFTLTGTGDADLYVRGGAPPTATTYDCRPYKIGSNEGCRIGLTRPAVIYVSVRGNAASSTVTLAVSSGARSGSVVVPGPDLAQSKDELRRSFGSDATEAPTLYDPRGDQTLDEPKQQVLAGKARRSARPQRGERGHTAPTHFRVSLRRISVTAHA
jgi:hypothetical protein